MPRKSVSSAGQDVNIMTPERQQQGAVRQAATMALQTSMATAVIDGNYRSCVQLPKAWLPGLR